MPRANRHYLPNHIWHLTHRCHKREFLLKFGRDRNRWRSWLFEARKRYGLSILNYVVTSNHIHLLVFAGEDRHTIPLSLQLLAGRTGQQFNCRKSRQGAFWEDRYHATAIENGEHLNRCMTYIDMNMVRAGVVNHPGDWRWSGYVEIQNPPRRYTVIDRSLLCSLLNFSDHNALAAWREHCIATALDKHVDLCRERCAEWTESIAVGSHAYVHEVQNRLGMTAINRRIKEIGKEEGAYVLCEESKPYKGDFTTENEVLSSENTLPWRLIS